MELHLPAPQTEVCRAWRHTTTVPLRAALHSRCKPTSHIAAAPTQPKPFGSTYMCNDVLRIMSSKMSRVKAYATIQGTQPNFQLNIVTPDGRLYKHDISPGVTTVGELRRAVAQLMNAEVNLVRLAYRANELPPADDGRVFNFRPEDPVLHAMRRSAAPESVQEPKRETLKVHTMEGRVHQMTVTPGVTTAGDIRSAVAAATGASASEVRLQYAGHELDPINDRKVLNFKPNVFVLHTMKRMTGGSSSSSSSRVQGTDSEVAGRRSRRPKTDLRTDTQQRASGMPSLLKSKSVASSPSKTPLTSLTDFELAHEAAAAAAVFKDADRVAAKQPVTLSQAVTAPGARVGPAAAVQLAKQFRDLLQHPIPGVSAAPDDDNPLKWHVRLAGPENSPYAEGWFCVELQFPNRFPGMRPVAHFKTKIWHPNVDTGTGKVCFNIGNEVCSVGCVLSALQQLLKHPNPDSPLNHECAEMMKDMDSYLQKARAMTQQYAMD